MGSNAHQTGRISSFNFTESLLKSMAYELFGDDELPTEAEPNAARKLLRLGTDVEVLAPASLRAAVTAEARRVAQRHEKSRPVAAWS
ncbi:MAG: WYL domain-containing protein [Rubrivivax sp.]